MHFFALIFIVMIAAVAVFLRYFIKRALETVGITIEKKRYKLILWASSVAVTVLMFSFVGYALVVILHLAALTAVLAVVNRIIRRVAGAKYESGFAIWKKSYGLGIIPILITAVIILLGYINMNNVVETNYTIYTDKDIREEGYRVAFIADVHYGVSLDDEALIEKCNEISGKNADIVILGGDIVDNSTTPEGLETVFRALGKIKNKYGIYYIYGNHDRSMRMMESDFTDDNLNRIIRENGIRILQDDVIEIGDDLTLIGREDKSRNNRLSVAELLESADREDFLLVADHQPNQYKENGEAGTDLLLSGHTHGGQLFPVNLLMEIVPFNDGVYGEYTIGEDSKAIVTSGFAAWSYPFKTAAPSEYMIIDIKGSK